LQAEIAVDLAWLGTRRVWGHTCSLDYLYALANYQARGLQVYREDVTP
jgi:hypothetical protein